MKTRSTIPPEKLQELAWKIYSQQAIDRANYSNASLYARELLYWADQNGWLDELNISDSTGVLEILLEMAEADFA